MPLMVSCRCGKRLRVPDDSAGKRVRCPGCEQALTVPSSSATPPPPPAASAPAAGTVQFACACGRQLRVKSEFAGRLTRCPECGVQTTVPDKAGSGTPVPPARVRADRPPPPPARPAREVDRPRRRDEDDDRPRRRDEDDRPRRRDEAADHRDEARPRRRDEEDDYRPRRKDRRSRGRAVWPWVLIGSALFVLLLGGGGLATWYFFLRSSGDMAYVPADAQGFVSIRVADVWKNGDVQKGIKEASGAAGVQVDAAAEMEKATGLRPEEVERLTIVFKDVEKESGWLIVSTVKAYDQKKILGKFTSPREVKHEGKTYHAGGIAGLGGPMGGEGGKTGAVHFASPKVLIVGPEEGVKQCLTFAAGKRPSGPLSDAIKRADGKDHFVAAFNAAAGGAGQKMKDTLGKGGGPYAPILDAQVATLVGNFGDTASWEATLRYANEGQAGQAKTAIDGGVAMLQQFRQQFEDKFNKGGAPPEAQKTLDAVKDAANSLKVEQKGTDVTIRVSVKTSAVEGILPRGGPKR